MNKQTYSIGGVVLVFLAFAALFGFRSTDNGSESGFTLSREAPFEQVSIPEKYSDDATRAVIEKNIDQTKTQFESYPDMWETWVAIGNMYLQLEDYDLAIAAYTISVDIQPSNFIAIRNIAQVYETNLNDFISAEKYYRKAISANILLVQNYIDLGRMLHRKMEQPDDAEAVFREGLVHTSNSPDMLLQLIELYERTENEDAAQEAATMLLDRFPTDQYKKAYSKYLK